MEFDINFNENPTFHQSFFREKTSKPQMENGFLIGSSSPNGLYQNFPNFDQFSIEGSSSSNLTLGVLTPFYDPFDPFQPSSINGCANLHFGSNGATHFMHGSQNVGFMNYHPRILLQALNQGQTFQPLNYQEFRSANANLSDEVSCLTMEDGFQRKVESKKKKVQPKKNKKVYPNPILVKGQWTAEEDRLLVQLVKQYGEKKWSHIAQMLNGRVGKQCRERWHNHLRPDIKKDIWSEEEEMMLIEVHKQIGNKWAAIARKMPGRTENTIKNHWNATKRRRFSKRKGQYNSILQEYINSLPSDSTVTDHQESPPSDSNLQIVDISDLEHRDQTNPTSDLDKAVDFDFYSKLSLEGHGFGSMMMLDEMPCDSVVDESNNLEMEMEMAPELMEKEMSFDVKKDMELLEMLYQGIF